LAGRRLLELLLMRSEKIHMLQKSLVTELFEPMAHWVDTVDLAGLKPKFVSLEKKAYFGIDSKQSNSIVSVSIRET
jgi:hypothetical protein